MAHDCAVSCDGGSVKLERGVSKEEGKRGRDQSRNVTSLKRQQKKKGIWHSWCVAISRVVSSSVTGPLLQEV
jgi:hypothetical protein